MIKVEYLGRLGNNLFQYSLGRVIAEELGYSLSAGTLDRFPRTNDVIGGVDCGNDFNFYKGFKIPLSEILSSREKKGIVLRGYFQRSEYYLPFKHRISKWMEISPTSFLNREDFTCLKENTITVNVRRTDYVENRWALPFDYYEQAIEKLRTPKMKIVIVTDDHRDPFFWKFKRYSPQYFVAPPSDQLLFMSNSPKLVMSQSAFSWWGSFLAINQTTVCPRPRFGCWSGKPPFEECDLIDGNGFEILPCNEAYRPTIIEKAYQRYRNLSHRIQNRLKRHR
jgi:hypothetical protein